MAATLAKPTMIVKQGAARRFLLTFKNKDGTPYNLTGKTVHFGVKDSANDEDFYIRKSSAQPSEIVFVGPDTDGIARLFILPLDTAKEAMLGDYVWDAWIDDGAGDEVPASDVAKFTVSPRVVALT